MKLLTCTGCTRSITSRPHERLLCHGGVSRNCFPNPAYRLCCPLTFASCNSVQFRSGRPTRAEFMPPSSLLPSQCWHLHTSLTPRHMMTACTLCVTLQGLLCLTLQVYNNNNNNKNVCQPGLGACGASLSLPACCLVLQVARQGLSSCPHNVGMFT